MAKSSLKTASVLAFERKLANSDAIMSAGNWDQRLTKEVWSPIVIQEKAVRGTTSHRLKNPTTDDPAKLDQDEKKANLQRIDVATLPFERDTLRVSFTLRVLGDLVTPSACNDQAYQSTLTEKINQYAADYHFSEVAARYAENIANARFLWRNRVGAETVEVHVRHVKNQTEVDTWVFNAFDFNLRQFSKPSGDVARLAEVIRQGLAGDSYVFLEVDAFVRLGSGQEVFPSQELVLEKNRALSNKKGRKSRFLYQVDGTAAIHSQKIGNALRTIDTWYPEAGKFGPIAVEPYGSVTNRGAAYRQPAEKVDFYTLLDNWMLKDELLAPEEQHYVIATLIRGGVFGEKKAE